MRLVSFASRICLARSSPNKSFDDGDTLLEQILWNSCFNDGLSCSRLINEISETTCPTRVIASMLSVTIFFVLIWDFTARSLSQVVTIAKVVFFNACYMLARCKSAFLLAALRGAHISGFTSAIDMPSQFSGCACFPSMLVIFSEFSLLPHCLMAISASCCCTFGPFLSPSCREATSSLSNSSSAIVFCLSVTVAAQTGGLARSCATSSSEACTLMQSSSLLDLRWAHSDVLRTHQRRGKQSAVFGVFGLCPVGFGSSSFHRYPYREGVRTLQLEVSHSAHVGIKLPQSCLNSVSEEGLTSTPSLVIVQYWIWREKWLGKTTSENV